MSPTRKTARSLDAPTPPPGHRPLTARSVLASALLGEDPPRLPVGQLVRLAAAFDINENRARVALSRMVASAEVRSDDGTYELISPSLLARQSRLRSARTGVTKAWTGHWLIAIVTPVPATASRRTERRRLLALSRFAEYRDGVWVRPDNLSGTAAVVGEDKGLLDDVHVVRAQSISDDDPQSMAAAVPRLWDLAAWSHVALDLMARLDELDPTDRANLAPCFELSAACLRHFQADPLLPTQLLPVDWPAGALRQLYASWDRSYRSVLRTLR
jgi:phenylacetic acid degradation operon negative regulatory protein